jgi:hypothetical protein
MTAAALTVLLSIAAPVPAGLTYGDGNFEAGGAVWGKSGDVQFLDGEAYLVENKTYDDHVSYTSIWQPFKLISNETTLFFDYLLYRDLATPGGETDMFEVLFDNELRPELFTPILAADTPLSETAQINVSSLSSGGHTLTFRLVGDEDEYITTVTLDNVRFGPVVPVPGAAVLGSMGLALAGWFCRRRTPSTVR